MSISSAISIIDKNQFVLDLSTYIASCHLLYHVCIKTAKCSFSLSLQVSLSSILVTQLGVHA
jgi:hypothetical protein